jgi:pimeloyl-ACP methyl ester carboxylesterase
MNLLVALSAIAVPVWEAALPKGVSGAPDIQHTAWSVAREPKGPFDRIEVHRYRAEAPPVATLLYLPGTNMNGEVALADEKYNLWIFLARRGVDVFTLDYRTNAIPEDATPAQLESLKGWTAAAFVGDIQAASELARRESGRARLFVAGFSRGVSLAYAYAGTEPDRVAGLIALDGSFKSHDPKNQYDRAAELQKLEASKAWATDVSGRLGWEGRQNLMRAVARDRDGPATDPKYRTIGDQLSNLLGNAWGRGALANPLDGKSRPEILAKLLAGYDRYYPAVQDLDGRLVADYADAPETPLDDLWGEMKFPVLLFANTNMAGDWLLNSIYSAQKGGSPDVTVHVLENHGHLDVIVGEQALKDVFEPTLAWIKKRATPPSS